MGGSHPTAALYNPQHKLYLSATSEGAAETRSTKESEGNFEIQYHGKCNVSLRSIHGRYLSAQPDGSFLFNSNEARESELFKVVGKYTGRVSLRA